ncbi:MAG: trimethylamine methyltransferase family protein [Hyphomicrobiales bacterium]
MTRTKRTRTGGARRARQESGAATAAPKVIAGIKRKIPTFDLFGDDQLSLIEEKIDALLETVGIEFRGDEEALDLWRNAGTDVKGECVHFPPGLVRSIITENAPSEFTHHARNPARSVKIGNENLVFVPTYGPPFVRDLDAGRRYASLEDFEKFVKLTYACPWLHHSGGVIGEPVDIPVNKRHLDMVYAHLRYSDKPILGSIITQERAEDSIAIARLVFGEEFVANNCVIMGNVNANSPLVFDGEVSRVMRTYARAGQGMVIAPFILGGAMGPVSTIGAVVQAVAEGMAGIATCQLERPGAPVILGNFLSSTNLRSGAPTFGTPEPALGSYVVGQLARRLGVPLRCSGAFTSSKVPDGQAMSESTMSMLAAVQCGANFVLHSAGWLEGGLVLGYEKFMMDADRLGALHTYLGGLSLTDNDFAMDAFSEVGPGGHFFGCAHTMANYETAFFESALADSKSFEQWRDEGEYDEVHRANLAWKDVLAKYQVPPMDDAIDEALKEFTTTRKASMEDSWY